jgi:hypothetical protein
VTLSTWEEPTAALTPKRQGKASRRSIGTTSAYTKTSRRLKRTG